MPAVKQQQPEVSEAEAVEQWREQQLRAAGWPASKARRLAADHNVDLHQACSLLERGCTVAVAWEILR